MTILEQFGIEWKLLITQLINFAVLAIIFWKFILPRVTKLLDERKRTIAESLQAAEQARQEAAAAEVAREAGAKAARAEAAAMIKEAKEAAAAEADRIIAAARIDAEKLAARQAAQLAAEQQKLRDELRAELAALTVETTRRVLSDVVREEDSDKLIAAAIEHVGKEAGGKRG